MEKRRVLLIHTLPLLGEGLQRIFQQMEDVDLVSLECTHPEELEACLQGLHPDIVLLAGEREDDSATHLISNMLKHYADIPIVWVELETNLLRLYTSHSLTATSAELINAIREHDANQMEIRLMKKTKHPGSKRR